MTIISGTNAQLGIYVKQLQLIMVKFKRLRKNTMCQSR